MKKLIDLLEASSSDVRSKISSLGYDENAKELTSGGELTSELSDILIKLMDDWVKIGGKSCKLMFTSGNDKFHKNRKNSLHKTGQAVDITLPKNCHSSFIKLLNTYKSKYNGFSFIDEYTNPSKGATGGHFHLSYKSGSPESSSSVDGDTVDTQQPTANSGYQSYMSDIANSFAKGLLPTNENRLIKNIDKIKKLLK